VKTRVKEQRVRGIPISHGIGIGRLILFNHDDSSVLEKKIPDEQIETEIKRYENALSQSFTDIERLKKRMKTENSLEAAAILETHLEILHDPLLIGEIKEQIRLQKKNAEFIFAESLRLYTKKFSELDDPFFRERGRDLLDVSRRILGYLKESGRASFSEVPPNSVVYAQEITASDVAEADPSLVVAMISDTGGTTAHAAIVAKAKGIPYIANIGEEVIKKALDSEAIVDGRLGELILFPDKATTTSYRQTQKKLEALFKDLEKTCFLGAETCDGYQVTLSANIEMVSEIDLLHQYGGSGVGLFRSEYLFLSKQSFPSEEEQYQIYSQVVNNMRGLPLVIRTFDVGGDKLTVEQQTTHKGNPYLGCRAIRFLLKERDIFKSQLRAILRAGQHGPVSIMFPMISDLSELMEAKEIVEEVKQELFSGSREANAHVPIGCMIEVPSAATISDLLAKESDFLAIGTNDLVQYLLAVDRSNQAINKFYTPMHPALIRMIKLIVTQASQYNVPVSVCGEIAGDPRFTPLLIGLGVQGLSVTLRNLPLIKNMIRHSSYLRSHSLAEEVLGLSTAQQIEELLTKEYESVMPADFQLVVKN